MNTLSQFFFEFLEGFLEGFLGNRQNAWSVRITFEEDMGNIDR